MSEMKRASNFCDEEQSILVNLVLNKYKNAIENKITNACSNREKDAAWETLTNIYNQIIPRSRKRTSRTLRLKYENIKKCLRKKIGRMKLEQTTGLSSIGTLKDFEKPLVSLMGISSDRLPIIFDNPIPIKKSAVLNEPVQPPSQPTSDDSSFVQLLFKQEIPDETNLDEIVKEDVDVMQSILNFSTTTNLEQSSQNETVLRRPILKKRHKRVLARDCAVLNNVPSVNSATTCGQPGENDSFNTNQSTYKNNYKKLAPKKYGTILNMVKKYDMLADSAMKYFVNKISVMKEESLLTKQVLRKKIEILELEKELLQYKVNEFRNK